MNTLTRRQSIPEPQISSPRPPSSRLSLQNLPTEILHQILRHAFHDHYRPTWSILVWLSAQSTIKRVDPTDALSPRNPPAILSVCRHLHSEGWSVLLEGQILGLSLFTDCDEPELDAVVEWFREKNAEWLLRRIRVLRVVGGWPRRSWGGEKGGALVGLRRVVIRMGWSVRTVIRLEEGEAAREKTRRMLEGDWSDQTPHKLGLGRSDYSTSGQQRSVTEMAKWSFAVEQSRDMSFTRNGRALTMVSASAFTLLFPLAKQHAASAIIV